MVNYLYDGTFEGLLTLIATAMTRNWELDEIAGISATGPQQFDLFTQIETITTDAKLAQSYFEHHLAERFSEELLTDIIYCCHSELAGVELLLLRFIHGLLGKGERFAGNIADPTVFKFGRIRDRVAHEIHRYHGFIRFRKLPNAVYYAAIEPDHNVIRFLAPHFTARFADQSWLIHDLKRNTGLYFDLERCSFLTDFEILPELVRASVPYEPGCRKDDCFDRKEVAYQELWNAYFQQIAIRERENRKAQRQRMPERYWRHLVERAAD